MVGLGARRYVAGVNLTRALALCGVTALGGCAPARPPPGSVSRVQPAMMPPPGAGSPEVSSAQDPTVTDADKYTLVTENARVRVLRYHDTPGAKTHPHRHPDSVLHALSAFRRRLTFPDGRTVEREFKAGDVMWVPAQTHVGENIGETETEVLLIEVK